MTDAQRLAEIGGVHEATIRRWLPTWLHDYEAMLAGTTETGISLALSAETLRKHEADLRFCREIADDIKLEIKHLGKLESRLLAILEQFKDSPNAEDYSQALALWNAYFSAAGSRKSRMSEFLAVAGRWQKSANVDALREVAVTREKAMATGRAKLAIAAEAREAGVLESANPGDPAGGEGKPRRMIFRRGEAPAQDAESADDGLY